MNGTKNKNRPKVTPLSQQNLPTYGSNMSWLKQALICIVIGIIFIVAGVELGKQTTSIIEHEHIYDDGTDGSCHISERNENKTCIVNFSLDEDSDDDLYVYYRLTNFYQNHQRYIQSISYKQLQGMDLSASELELTCNPLLKTTDHKLLNPCGLIANSFFNDIISLQPSSRGYALNEKDISLYIDRKYKFEQVSGFKSHSFTSQNSATANSFCQTNYPSYNPTAYYSSSSDLYYCFYYPNDGSTMYLYESYPDIISPIEGVTNEHFMVWMRIELLPSFRKLYGKIKGPFKKGDQLSFNLTNNFEVGSFKGTKSLVLSSLGPIGGRNRYPALILQITGIISLFMGLVFLVLKLRNLKRSRA